MGFLKKVGIVVLLAAAGFAAYQTYSRWQQDKVRLEQDARMIADMLKESRAAEKNR